MNFICVNNLPFWLLTSQLKGMTEIDRWNVDQSPSPVWDKCRKKIQRPLSFHSQILFVQNCNSPISIHIKIQPKTVDLSTRLRGISNLESINYSPGALCWPEVYYFKLNFNISKLVYSPPLWKSKFISFKKFLNFFWSCNPPPPQGILIPSPFCGGGGCMVNF